MISPKKKTIRDTVEKLAELKAEELAEAMVDQRIEERIKAGERKLARRSDPSILSGAFVETLKQSIDEKAELTAGPTEIDVKNTRATAYQLGGHDGKFMFIVNNRAKKPSMRLWHGEYAPMVLPYSPLESDSGPEQTTVSKLDIKAWVGYVETVSSGFDPRLTLDDKGDEYFDDDPKRMRKRMAEVGHKVIIECGADPDKLAELAQTHIDDRMRASSEQARMMLGETALTLIAQTEYEV